MRRSIKYPAIILIMPQVLCGVFYGLMKAIGVPWEWRAPTYTIIAGIALIICCAATLAGLFDGADGWLEMDRRDAEALRQKHEEELRRLDDQIGIPRIPVRR